MRIMKTSVLGVLVSLGSLAAVGSISGCGESGPVSEVKQSPEAKKADQGLQDAMKDMMQNKTQSKGAAKK